MGVSILAALTGVVLGVRRRAPGVLVLGFTLAAPVLFVSPLVSPYIDAKLLVVLTPAVVFLGAFAALTLLDSRQLLVKLAGGATLVLVAAGVLVSDLYGFRDVQLAPADRVEQMEDVAAHVPDDGLYLLNEWEEYGKFFMRAARVNPAAEVEAPRLLQLRADRGVPVDSPKRVPRFGRWFDLDEQTLPGVLRFAGIIQRRSPAASRPPAAFRRIYRNGGYELWRRDPRVVVRAHLPLQGGERAAAVPDCARVRRLARTARPGDRLTAAAPRRVGFMSPLVSPAAAGVAGHDGAHQQDRRARPRRARARGEHDQGRRAAGGMDQVHRGPCRHRVRRRPAGGQRQRVQHAAAVVSRGQRPPAAGRPPAPDRDHQGWRLPGPRGLRSGFVGPVALQAARPAKLVSVAPRDAGRLCGRSWDWIELVGRRR